MVAPNGARKTKQDHPQLPITLDEVIETSKACYAAGADGLHFHLRDEEGGHILDAGLYHEAIQALAHAAPQLQVQITTEAVGIYTPDQQRNIVRECMPKSVSISPKELFANGEIEENLKFYQWCDEADIAVQHILYSAEDFQYLRQLNPIHPIQLLFVLGRYTKDQESDPNDLQPFLDKLKASNLDYDWALCAFGKSETQCLLTAHAAGGKMRIGFENSPWNNNGELARDNAERVKELKRMLPL